MLRYPMFSVRVTHMPTGLSAEVTSQCARTQWEAKEKAMRLLRSRVYAKTKMGVQASDYVYDLPDSEPWPNDLGVYKQPDTESN